MDLAIYTDAGSRGNPGPAAIAILIYEGPRLVKQHMEYIGEATNNQAEYRAVIKALELADLLSASEVRLFTDSELVCRQITGQYRIKEPGLKPLHARVMELEKKFRKFSCASVPRENPRTRFADRLVNKVLDSREEGVW